MACTALIRACWSGGSAGAGLSPRPSAYAFSPTATTTASAEAASATALAWSGAYVTFGSSACRPVFTVVPGGIWLGGPMQHTCPAPNTPCQLTLQPPSWLDIESALGPVTTTRAVGASGSTLFWLRSSVMDSRAAARVASRPAVTAASALLASTYGWSNNPSSNFSRRIRRTDWSIRATETRPCCTSCMSPVFQPT